MKLPDNYSIAGIREAFAKICNVNINNVTVLIKNDNQCQVFVFGYDWYNKDIANVISKAWQISANCIKVEKAPEIWSKLGSIGYIFTINFV